ncbi:MAG: hypothetical protein C0392_04880 [Syntrophus sp. (in: bacteria)]|nr:hypothetical protein [Syntrophus sp. (in: bacteria)]
MEPTRQKKTQLLKENLELRRRIAELEGTEARLRHTEAKLQKIEEQFHAIADYTFDWESWVGPDGKAQWINKGVSHFIGYTTEECLSMTDFPLPVIHESDLPRIGKLFEEAVGGSQGNNAEFRIHCKDGTIKWASVSWQPVYDAKGIHLGHRSSVRDISARKETEKALQESEKRFRRLAENARDMIYRMSLPDGRYEYVSPASIDLTGYTPEEFYNDPLLARKVMHPDWSDYFVQQWKKLIKGEIPPPYEFKIIHKSGGERWLYVRNVPVSNTIGHAIAIEGVVTDITERKFAEQALQESESKFSAAFMKSGIPMTITTISGGQYIDVNEAFSKTMGLTREEIIGNTSVGIGYITTEQRSLFLNELNKKGYVENFELQVKIRAGELRHALFNSTKIILAGREYFLTIVTDITERIRAEHALRESEERFRRFHEVSFGGIGIHAKGIILEANLGLATLTGYELDELIGMNGLNLIAPEYHDLVMNNILADFEKPYEVKGLRKDGSTYPLEIHGKSIPYGGINVRVTEFRDITERKQAEAALKESEGKYRSIFINSPLGIFQSTFEGKFIRVNPALAQMLGYESPQDVTDSISDMATQIYAQPEHRARILEKILESDGYIIHEIEYLRKDGKQWTGHLTMSVIHDENGIPHHLDGIVEDVTEKRTMEEKLQHTMEHLRTLSHRLLEIQEAERRYIACELHDEIGQTLTALRISLKHTERSKASESATAALNESVKMVDGLIKQVRNLSIELRPSILDDFGLPAALEWYIKRLSDRAGFHAAFHTVFREERLSPLIELTCFRIAQEALTNIVRHANAKEVHVALEAHSGELHLIVRDNGNGFNVDKTHKRALKGKSFGILGMQERATLAGGHLELKSQPGQGTEVHAYFPLGLIT